jgi:hypothetical protein
MLQSTGTSPGALVVVVDGTVVVVDVGGTVVLVDVVVDELEVVVDELDVVVEVVVVGAVVVVVDLPVPTTSRVTVPVAVRPSRPAARSGWQTPPEGVAPGPG